MNAVHYVCFDTNILIKEGWPRLSSQLSGLLGFMDLSSIQPLLPIAVEAELRIRVERELRNRIEQIQAGARRLESYTKWAGAPKHSIGTPTIEEYLASYDNTVAELKSAFNFLSVPLTERSIEHFWWEAALRKPPFEDEGKGFKDAVILDSLVTFLSQERRSAVFVSSDRIFGNISYEAIERQTGAIITHIEDVSKLDSFLYSQTTSQAQGIWSHERILALNILLKNGSKLERFIRDSLRISPSDLGQTTGNLVNVNGIQLEEPQEPFVPYPEEHTGDSVELFFDVPATFLITKRVYHRPPEPQFTIGGGAPQGYKLVPPQLYAGMSHIETESVKRNLNVTARATRTLGYEDIEFVSVHFQMDWLTLDWAVPNLPAPE